MTYEQKHKLYQKLITSLQYRRLRDRYIGEHPLCEACKAEGRITQATEVHHIRRVEGGYDFPAMRDRLMDYHNLRSLCHTCHTRIHASMGWAGKGKRGTQAKRDEARAFAEKFYGETPGGVF